MNSFDNTAQETLQKFRQDVLWWKSMIICIVTEITFINRLLKSNLFETTHPHDFEQLHNYKHQIKTVTWEMKNLKEIVDGHENKMRGMTDCDDLECDDEYISNHESLKAQFEKSLTNYCEYKSKVYNYLGGVLKNP